MMHFLPISNLSSSKVTRISLYACRLLKARGEEDFRVHVESTGIAERQSVDAVVYTFCMPDSLRDSFPMAMAAPFAVFAVMLLLFSAMKRWCPCLLRPVAYYKINSRRTV